MHKPKPFRLGVVEGFFGTAWSWRTRTDYAGFLQQEGFDSYLYAPKSDAFLRKEWQRPLPAEHHAQLQKLARHYQGRQLNFGLGLSPFELYRDFGNEQKQLLLKKIHELNSIGADSLCLLFDDMRGDLPGLARRQADIMAFISEHSNAGHFMFCPSYYSDDPALERIFGKMPDNYLQDIGSLLDPVIDIFWTGPLVLSRDFSAAHLRDISERLQRKVLIWENYPVNDASRLCDYLHLAPFRTDTAAMQKYCSGHFANPMNQAWLSTLALYSLAELYRSGRAANADALFAQACAKLCPPELARLLRQDAALFQEQGLRHISASQRAILLENYGALRNEPMAREVIAWLHGEYTFDPACLT